MQAAESPPAAAPAPAATPAVAAPVSAAAPSPLPPHVPPALDLTVVAGTYPTEQTSEPLETAPAAGAASEAAASLAPGALAQPEPGVDFLPAGAPPAEVCTWTTLGWPEKKAQSLAEVFRSNPGSDEESAKREPLTLLQRSLAFLVPNVQEATFKNLGVWCDETSKAVSSFQDYHKLSGAVGLTEERFWEQLSDEVRKRDMKEMQKKAQREEEKKKSKQVRQQRRQLQDIESNRVLEQMLGLCQKNLDTSSSPDSRVPSKAGQAGPPGPTPSPPAVSGTWGAVPQQATPPGPTPAPAGASGTWGSVPQQAAQPGPGPSAAASSGSWASLPQQAMAQSPPPPQSQASQHATPFGSRTHTPPPSGSRPSSASSSRGPVAPPPQHPPASVAQAQPAQAAAAPPGPTPSPSHGAGHPFPGATAQAASSTAVPGPALQSFPGAGGIPVGQSSPPLQGAPQQASGQGGVSGLQGYVPPAPTAPGDWPVPVPQQP